MSGEWIGCLAILLVGRVYMWKIPVTSWQGAYVKDPIASWQGAYVNDPWSVHQMPSYITSWHDAYVKDAHRVDRMPSCVTN